MFNTPAKIRTSIDRVMRLVSSFASETIIKKELEVIAKVHDDVLESFDKELDEIVNNMPVTVEVGVQTDGPEIDPIIDKLKKINASLYLQLAKVNAQLAAERNVVSTLAKPAT
jgi:hypothetical protein